MSGWWLHTSSPDCAPVYVDTENEVHLKHGRNAASVRWDAPRRRLRLRVRRGAAHVRPRASSRFCEKKESENEIDILHPGQVVVALDAWWLHCYRFHTDEHMPQEKITQHHAPGADVRRCLWRLPIPHDIIKNVARFMDWSEDGLCAAAARAALELDHAQSEFEALHLQMGRTRAPCSAWRHLPASLSACGADADDGIWLAWEDAVLRSRIALRQQPNYRHRGRVVEWMMRAADNLQLSLESLHRAVHALDRCMRRAPVAVDRLQALGAAALVLGSKYEGIELTPREVDTLAFLHCPRHVIREMEWYLASRLGYRLGGATALCWVRHLRRKTALQPVQRYLLDQSLLDGAALELTRPQLARQLLGADRLPQLLDRLQMFDSLSPDYTCTSELYARHLGRVELRGAVPLQLYCRAVEMESAEDGGGAAAAPPPPAAGPPLERAAAILVA